MAKRKAKKHKEWNTWYRGLKEHYLWIKLQRKYYKRFCRLHGFDEPVFKD